MAATEDEIIALWSGLGFYRRAKNIYKAKEIIKNSNVRLFLVDNNIQLAKFLKNNMYGKKIVIGMGAGSISNWMQKLPQLI